LKIESILHAVLHLAGYPVWHPRECLYASLLLIFLKLLPVYNFSVILFLNKTTQFRNGFRASVHTVCTSCTWYDYARVDHIGRLLYYLHLFIVKWSKILHITGIILQYEFIILSREVLYLVAPIHLHLEDHTQSRFPPALSETH